MSTNTENAKNTELKTNQPPPLLWDINTAAQRLSVSEVTIRKLVRQGRLARVPGVRKLLIPDVSLQRFANSAFK
jgi:excisionase family DNA binding protein